MITPLPSACRLLAPARPVAQMRVRGPVRPVRCCVSSSTGAAKQQVLWEAICRTEYRQLPPWRAPHQEPIATLSSLGRLLVDPIFVREVVDLPYAVRSDVAPERQKLFHRYGCCATAAFEACSSPFTGMFAQPSSALVRLSLATSPELFAPGIAVKMLRDGASPSANWLAAPALDPQPDQDFFARSATTRVAPPTSPLARFFFALLGQRHDPYGIDLREDAACDVHGRAVARPCAPGSLTFVPQVSLPAGQDIRGMAAQLQPGCTLWTVEGEGLPIGHIVLTSRFVASAFGDRQLLFAHR